MVAKSSDCGCVASVPIARSIGKAMLSPYRSSNAGFYVVAFVAELIASSTYGSFSAQSSGWSWKSSALKICAKVLCILSV